MVGCSIINQVIFRPSEASFQSMAPLMILCWLSNIILLCSLWKSNMVMFKDGRQLFDLLLHALDFRMKSPHTIRTLSLFNLFLFLELEAPSEDL